MGVVKLIHCLLCIKHVRLYLQAQLKLKTLHLKTKLGSFQAHKLNYDKMAGHIKVGHKLNGYAGSQQHVLSSIIKKMSLLSSRLSRLRRRSKRSFWSFTSSCEQRRLPGLMQWGKRRRSRMKRWTSGLLIWLQRSPRLKTESEPQRGRWWLRTSHLCWYSVTSCVNEHSDLNIEYLTKLEVFIHHPVFSLFDRMSDPQWSGKLLPVRSLLKHSWVIVRADGSLSLIHSVGKRCGCISLKSLRERRARSKVGKSNVGVLKTFDW